jgi:hypothetical protein
MAISLMTIIFGCTDSNISPANVAELPLATDHPVPYQFDGNNPPESKSSEIQEYKGKTIDQIFPILSKNDLSRGGGDRGKYKISV